MSKNDLKFSIFCVETPADLYLPSKEAVLSVLAICEKGEEARRRFGRYIPKRKNFDDDGDDDEYFKTYIDTHLK
jgi:hypothetical protein